MKKLIIIFVVLAVLGAGGYAGYYYMQHGHLPGQDPAAPQEAKPETLVIDTRYVELPPITISVIEQGRVTKLYSAFIVLEVIGAEDEALVQAMLPRLRSAYLEHLHALGALTGAVDLTNMPLVREQMTMVTKRVLGNNVVKAVLLQTAFERKT